MASLAGMVLNDPSSFHLLTVDMKERIIEAAIDTVNMQAAMARKKALANIQSNFTTRNSWTAKQIQFTQMPKGRYALSAIHSTIGATEDAAYMERQELGGRHEPKEGGKNLAIATLQARGGNAGSLVKKNYRLSNLAKLKVTGEFTEETRKSRQVARAEIAFRERKLLRYGENLFFVDNFVARDGKVSFTKRMLYHMDKSFTVTKANPWLLPAAESVMARRESIFESRMRKAGL